MEITFDPAKREATLIDRGVDFRDAGEVFAGRTITSQDVRFAYGETRYQTVGYLRERMMMLVRTPRGDARHIISMRKCNEKEQTRYRQRLEEA